jgi:hypothetical protein
MMAFKTHGSSLLEFEDYKLVIFGLCISAIKTCIYISKTTRKNYSVKFEDF